ATDVTPLAMRRPTSGETLQADLQADQPQQQEEVVARPCLVLGPETIHYRAIDQPALREAIQKRAHQRREFTPIAQQTGIIQNIEFWILLQIEPPRLVAPSDQALAR